MRTTQDTIVIATIGEAGSRPARCVLSGTPNLYSYAPNASRLGQLHLILCVAFACVNLVKNRHRLGVRVVAENAASDDDHHTNV